MIPLKKQIILLIFSFFYGIFFSRILTINYKITKKKKFLIKTLFDLLTVVLSLLIYFIGIKKICNAIIHPYSLLAIIGGFFVDICLLANIAKKGKL
jgi:hypothetical protein